MKAHYVNNNAQSNGDHEVHVEACKYFPDAANRKYLGMFTNCSAAVTAAKSYYHQV